MPNSKSTDQPWFSVRCILHHRHLNAYEERITLWRAANIDQAITQAEQEARDYAHDLPDAEYAELAQAYQLGEAPGDGNEVFSLIREGGIYLSQVGSRHGLSAGGRAGERIGSVGRGRPGRGLTIRLR